MGNLKFLVRLCRKLSRISVTESGNLFLVVVASSSVGIGDDKLDVGPCPSLSESRHSWRTSQNISHHDSMSIVRDPDVWFNFKAVLKPKIKRLNCFLFLGLTRTHFVFCPSGSRVRGRAADWWNGERAPFPRAGRRLVWMTLDDTCVTPSVPQKTLGS